MRKILQATLELDADTGLQRTEIVREHASGERTTEILIERPLTLVKDRRGLGDRGHEMVLARS